MRNVNNKRVCPDARPSSLTRIALAAHPQRLQVIQALNSLARY